MAPGVRLCLLAFLAALAYQLVGGVWLLASGPVLSDAAQSLLLVHVGVGGFVLVPALVGLALAFRLPRHVWWGGRSLLLAATLALGLAATLGSGTWVAVTGDVDSRLKSGLHAATGVLAAVGLLAAAVRSARSRRGVLGADRRFSVRQLGVAVAAVLLVGAGAQLATLAAVPRPLAGPQPLVSDGCMASSCHTQIAEDWRASAHARASESAYFRRVMQSPRAAIEPAATGDCARCHAPRVEPGRASHGAGAGTAEAGVSCVACHPSARAAGLPAGDSFLAGHPGALPSALHRFLIRTAPERHRRRLGSASERDASCTSCHEMSAAPTTRSCIDCHMPRIADIDPGGGRSRRSHLFAGAHLALSGRSGTAVEWSRDWLRASHLLVDIDPPRDPDASRNRSFVENEAFQASQALPYVTLGDEVELKVAVTNARVGHASPGDRSAVRQTWLDVRVVDGQNRAVFRSGGLDPNGSLDTDGTRVFQHGPAGEWIKGESGSWHNDTRIRGSRILPGRSDVSVYRFRVPHWAKGDLTVLARVRTRVHDRESHDWVFGPGTPPTAPIDLARATRNIPIRERPEREAKLVPASGSDAVPGSGLPGSTTARLPIPASGGARSGSTEPPDTTLRFAERTLESGIDFAHLQGGMTLTGLNDLMGSGVCAADFDADGDVDVFLVNGTGFTHHYGRRWWWSAERRDGLYRNRGDGTFEEVGGQAGVVGTGWGMGCAVGDYDGDGWPDLYVTNYGPNSLYHNRGDGRFEELGEAAGVADPRWGTSASWVDFDNDGDLDLYLLNYVAFDRTMNPFEAGSALRSLGSPLTRAELFDAEPNVLFRNEGWGRFTDVTGKMGLGSLPSRSLAAAIFDFDLDGLPDIYVANDESRNALLRNEGVAGFRDVGGLLGVDSRGSGTGVAAGDFDDDGDLDLFSTSRQAEPNLLYENRSARQRGDDNRAARGFRDQSADVGLGVDAGVGRTAWSSVFLDGDNDGDLDLFVANGHRLIDFDDPQVTVGQANQLFLNVDRRGFVDASESVFRGVDQAQSSRGAAAADFDNDGDLDLIVNNNNGRARLLVNQLRSPNHWLGLRLEGRASNRDAVGARVTLWAGDAVLHRTVQGASGYLSQSDTRLHFGLGSAREIDRLEVGWPSGRVQNLTAVPVDTWVAIVEGEDLAVRDPRRPPVAQPPPEETRLAATSVAAPSPALRLAAVSALGGVRSDAAVATLADLLDDPEAAVRRAAAQGLGALGLSGGLPPLLLRAKLEEHLEVRRALLESLARFSDERVVEPLARALDADPALRPVAARSLALLFEQEDSFFRSSILKKRRAVGAALRALDDDDPEVRTAVLRALGYSESYRAVIPVLEAFADPVPAVRRAAVAAAGRLRDRRATPACRSLIADESQPPSVRAEAVLTVRRLEGRAALDDLLGDGGIDSIRLLLALAADERSVLLQGVDVEPLLSKSLRTGDAVERELAVRVAGHRASVAPGWFAAALRDPSPAVRLAAATTAPTRPDPELRDALRERAADDVEAVREQAILALASQDLEPRDIRRLARWTMHSAPVGVRIAALSTWAKTGDPAAVERIESELSTAPSSLRPDMVALLGESPATAAIPVLVDRLAAGVDVELQRKAVAALGHRSRSRQAFDALAEAVGERTRPIPVRRAALAALVEKVALHRREGLVFLMAARVARNREDPLRPEAVEALGDLEEPRAAHLLAQIATDSTERLPLRSAALSALTRADPNRAEPLLIAASRAERFAR